MLAASRGPKYRTIDVRRKVAGSRVGNGHCIEGTSLSLVVKLRSAMERYSQSSGEQMTYERLATVTGLSRATLEAIGSRPEYNPTLATIERLCVALECEPGELLELERSQSAVARGSA